MSVRETIHRVRSVRLVAPDDAAYVEAMAEQALAHRRFGPKDVQSATYRVSGQVEMAVRSWLADRVPLLPERVIAAEVLYRAERSYVPLYLELDAVQGRDGLPFRVFEVKFTSNAAALRRGFAQLARARSLLEARYERIETAVVLVQAQHDPLVIDDARLADVVPVGQEVLEGDGALPPRALLRLDPDWLLPFLGDDDLQLLRAAREEGDANVVARLERSAAIERGEPPTLPARALRSGATLSFGDEEDGVDDGLADSPFAALRSLAGGVGGRDGDGPTDD